MKWLKNNVVNNPKINYFIRFCIVGGISTITTYIVYYLLVIGNLNATLSYSVGYIVAFIVNYLLTTSFTFRVKASKKNGLGFIVTNIINYLFSTVLLNGFIWFGVEKTWALLPVLMISVPVNYIMVKFVMKRG